MKKLRLLLSVAIASVAILFAPGCSSSPERTAHTTAVVSYNGVKAAYDGWVKDFVRRAQPYVVTVDGRKQIDYSKAPNLLAEKARVSEALRSYKGSNAAVIEALVAIKKLDGTNEAQVAELTTKVSESAFKLIEALRLK